MISQIYSVHLACSSYIICTVHTKEPVFPMFLNCISGNTKCAVNLQNELYINFVQYWMALQARSNMHVIYYKLSLDSNVASHFADLA